MSASHTTELTEQLATDYANYAIVDFSIQMKGFRDAIEDVMMRLEELQSIILMVQTEGAESQNNHAQRLLCMQHELINLCKRIDSLEQVAATATADLSALETAIENAEAEMGISDRLFGMLNPLSFLKKTQEPAASNKVPQYEPPPIYRTDDYFKQE